VKAHRTQSGINLRLNELNWP